jgi:phenylalanyl-tRNA synthetase alpha chain
MKENIVVNDQKEQELLAALEARSDIKAERAKRLLKLPDLSRKEGSPLQQIVGRVLAIPQFKDFDVIQIPEIISTEILFDLFDFAPNHVARSESDTYYVDEKHVLRTHDTVFWYYYLNNPVIQQRIANKEPLGTFCYGKVYRKDEIDRTHMNVFHQMGGLYLVPDDGKEQVTFEDLKNSLTLIVKSLFGEKANFRFAPETFPYTDPSIEIEVEINGKWIEILGSGMPKKTVLKNFGLEGYHGWAFGFGLERLGIIKMEIPDIRLFWSDDPRIVKQLENIDGKYKEVSKYPPIVRDISFIIDKSISLNNYYELVRDEADNLIEQVELTDNYENDEKFGADKKSYTFRIIYRSNERTLTNDEVNVIQKKIEDKTKEELNAVVR